MLSVAAAPLVRLPIRKLTSAPVTLAVVGLAGPLVELSTLALTIASVTIARADIAGSFLWLRIW